jgi:hypothetical protein
VTLGLDRKVRYFLFHTRGEAIISILEEFLLLEAPRVLAFSKISKKKGELREFEKSLLCGSAVLVHWFADDRKIHRRALEISVTLVVSMAEDQHFQHVQVPGAQVGVDAIEMSHQTRLVLIGKRPDDLQNALVPFQAFAFLEVGLESGFVVECHCTEASSLEVKVELHVLLCPSCAALRLFHCYLL